MNTIRLFLVSVHTGFSLGVVWISILLQKHLVRYTLFNSLCLTLLFCRKKNIILGDKNSSFYTVKQKLFFNLNKGTFECVYIQDGYFLYCRLQAGHLLSKVTSCGVEHDSCHVQHEIRLYTVFASWKQDVKVLYASLLYSVPS